MLHFCFDLITVFHLLENFRQNSLAICQTEGVWPFSALYFLFKKFCSVCVCSTGFRGGKPFCSRAVADWCLNPCHFLGVPVRARSVCARRLRGAGGCCHSLAPKDGSGHGGVPCQGQTPPPAQGNTGLSLLTWPISQFKFPLQSSAALSAVLLIFVLLRSPSGTLSSCVLSPVRCPGVVSATVLLVVTWSRRVPGGITTRGYPRPAGVQGDTVRSAGGRCACPPAWVCPLPLCNAEGSRDLIINNTVVLTPQCVFRFRSPEFHQVSSCSWCSHPFHNVSILLL